MNNEEKKFLLDLARRTIKAKLSGEPLPEAFSESDELNRPCGAFVTLKMKGSLRGCIGNIRATIPLVETIGEMAVAASTKDPRFPPMRPDELEQADIEISVLTPFEKVDDPESIVVGRDGLYIKKGFYSGLLLPQVAPEWGWDRETFLSQTCRKAGLGPDEWKKPGIEIYRFSAEVFGEDD